MMLGNVNYIAVLVSALAAFVVGWFWYSPNVFGKTWLKLMGWNDKKAKEMHGKNMTQSLIIGFISTLVMAYVLAQMLVYMGAVTFMEGVLTAFWLWLGFVATMQIGSVLWEGKPAQLFCINTLHSLVSMAIAGGILAVWV